MSQYYPKTIHNHIFDYVDVGAQQIAQIAENFVKENYVSKEDIIRFFKESLSNFLHSAGVEMTPLRKDEKKLLNFITSGKFTERLKKFVNYINSSPYLKHTGIFIDSGGYQIAIGIIPKKAILEYAPRYLQFLKETDDFSIAFSMDIPADYPIVNNVNELYTLNSYTTRLIFEYGIEDKITYVYHFRGKGLNYIWNQIMQKYNVFKYINKYAIGGFASHGKKPNIPFPMYIPQFVNVLGNAIKSKNPKLPKFHFHILGVSGFADFMQGILIALASREFHNIETHVTADSSRLFTQLARAYQVEIFLENKLGKLEFKSKELHKRNKFFNKSNYELCMQCINYLNEKYNFKLPTTFKVYDDNGKINKIFLNALILYMMNNCQQLIAHLINECKELINYYKTRQKSKFNMKVREIFKELGMSHSFYANLDYWGGLELIESLNINRAHQILNRLYDDFEVFKRKLA